MVALHTLPEGTEEEASTEATAETTTETAESPVVEFKKDSLDAARSSEEAKSLTRQEVIQLIMSQLGDIQDPDLRKKIEMHADRLLGSLIVVTEEASRDPSKAERIMDYLAGTGKLCEKWTLQGTDQQNENGTATTARKATRRKIETVEDEKGNLTYRFLDESDDKEDSKK